jgi:hypothetical protein
MREDFAGRKRPRIEPPDPAPSGPRREPDEAPIHDPAGDPPDPDRQPLQDPTPGSRPLSGNGGGTGGKIVR